MGWWWVLIGWGAVSIPTALLFGWLLATGRMRLVERGRPFKAVNVNRQQPKSGS